MHAARWPTHRIEAMREQGPAGQTLIRRRDTHGTCSVAPNSKVDLASSDHRLHMSQASVGGIWDHTHTAEMLATAKRMCKADMHSPSALIMPGPRNNAVTRFVKLWQPQVVGPKMPHGTALASSSSHNREYGRSALLSPSLSRLAPAEGQLD
jgi:hypothetical protein